MTNAFNLKRTTVLMTLNCNLNCKLCGAYVPYYEKSSDSSVSEHMEYIERFFQIVDHLELLTISGGEPLLYKQLPEFLDSLINYSDRFDKLEIITNGTIVPNENLVSSVKKYGNKFFRFLVDNYSLSYKIPEIHSLLEENNIPHVIRDNNCRKSHCNGWIDFGSLDNVIHSNEEAEKIFKKCAFVQKLSFCFGIFKGYMTPCGEVRYRLSLGKASPDEYINLIDKNVSIEDQRRKILNMYEGKYLETCKYCNGMLEDSPRFQPAIQLTPEELSEIQKKGRIKPIWDKL